MTRRMRAALGASLGLGLLLFGATPAAIPDAPITFIQVDELKTLLDRGAKVDIVDVRRPEAYAQQHIKSARSVPLQTFPDAARQIKKAGLVVLY